MVIAVKKTQSDAPTQLFNTLVKIQVFLGI